MKQYYAKFFAICACVLSMSLTANAQNQMKISGQVLDSQSQPVIGAGVKQAGTNNGVVTDIEGAFTLTVPAGSFVDVESLGYETQRFEVLSGKSVYNITLAEAATELDDVVVIGYGTQKKKLVTGSTINVTGEMIQKQSTTNAMGALYSSVPGVTITQSTGQPWDGYSITIRGLNTTGSSSPLFVIDGVAGGDINSLNPADIESIDILKDAASSAIYGARAANGVVLVTTKQAQKGRVSVSYDGYYGIQNANLNGIESVSGQEYSDLMDAAFLSNGTLKPGEHYFDLQALMPVQYQWMKSGKWNGTDWLKESVRKNAPTTSHSVNIAGGNDIFRYSLGFSKTYTEGTLGAPKKTYYDRTTARLNTEASLWRKDGRDIIRLGENLTLSLYDSNGVSTGNIYSSTIHTALVYTPLLPAYDLDGSLYTYEKQVRDGWNQADGAYNLLESYTYGEKEGKTLRAQGNAYIEILPHKDWKIRSVYGFNYYNKNTREYTPSYKLSGASFEDYDKVQQSSSTSYKWSWETTVDWKRSFGDHRVEALLGGSMEGTGWGQSLGASRRQTKMGTFESANLSSCASDIDSKNVSLWGSNTVPYKNLLSFFVRANYNYKDKYLVTVTVREDGSSNFAKGHRWGFFPSVSAGWIASNEEFMANTRTWLDYLKVRASWGRNGNCSIANFQYAATVSLSAPYDFTYAGTSISTGAYPDILPNEDLSWETSEQTDLGIDLRFLKSRLGLTFDWYLKDTKDWLVDAPTLKTYGTGAPTINGGAVRNSGVELSLSWNDKVGDLSYSIGLNGSYNKNKVLYINNAEGIIHGGTNVIAQNISGYNTFEARVGKPIGYFTGIASEGIFQNQAQIDQYKANGYAFIDGYDKAQPGDVIWIDQNGDGKYDRSDIVEIGNPHPDFNLGLNINLEWKGIDLAISGSGAFGQQVLQSYRSFAGSDTNNYTNNFVNRLWTGEGSTNSFPRFTYGKHNNFYCNSFVGDIWAQNADYFKIRNITIGYDLKKAIKKFPLQSLRIYLTGQNLITFTKYDGMDPEVGYGYGYSWTSGIDIGYYPSPKVYMVGLSVKF